jgi:hypothetical protein
VISEQFAFLWTTPGTRYVIVQLGDSERDRVIWDKQLHGVYLIDDDELHRIAIRQMEENGVPVLSDIPDLPPEVNQ